MPESVVLLHGFGGTHRAWDGVIAALDRERYRPLALDLPGHGSAADAERPITFAGCVDARARAQLRSASSCAAIRWADGSPCTSRSPRPSAWRGWCSSPPAPGIEDESERAARRAAPTTRLAE